MYISYELSAIEDFKITVKAHVKNMYESETHFHDNLTNIENDNKIKTQSKVSYYVSFKITSEEYESKKYASISDKIKSTCKEFNSFENAYICNSLLSNPKLKTITVDCPWTDYLSSNPLQDIETVISNLKNIKFGIQNVISNLKNIIENSRNIDEFTIVMSSKCYDMCKHDMLNDMVTKTKPKMRIITNDAVDPENVGQVIIFKTGKLGNFIKHLPIDITCKNLVCDTMYFQEYYLQAISSVIINYNNVILIKGLYG